ncbi:MAG: hypothetical protein WBC17_12230 [Mycobacterium sp.]
MPTPPDPRDESPHAPGDEPFWNESWDFDGVGADPEIGVYVRLGNVPNQGSCLYTVAVVRPGKPTVMVTDYAGSPPVLQARRQIVHGTDYEAVQECVTALCDFRVQFTGAAKQYADDMAVLRAEAGTPVTLTLDLRWITDAQPYAWQALTRYEIPCRVEGTVVIDGDEITVAGPGQRDHSWGARDWWAHDWMWSAFHLTDGTRVHAVMLPDMPGVAIGYLQTGGEITELTTGSSTYDKPADTLVSAAVLRLGEPDDALVIEVSPRGFGPLRLEAPDGRVTHFQRAMADFRTADGRSGVGWIEWNINQR